MAFFNGGALALDGNAFPLSAVLDSVGDAIAVFDEDWRYIYVNESASALARVPREHLVGRVIWDVFPELRQTIAFESCRQAAQSGCHQRFVDCYAPYDLWVEVDVWPFRGGAVMVIRDVSAAMRADENTRQLTLNLTRRIREFETLLNVIPVGIGVATDPACEDIRINPAFAALLGTVVRDNASKSGGNAPPFRVLRDGVEVSPDQLPMQVAAREAREVSQVELDVERADGSLATELAFARPLFDEQQKVRGSIGVFLDITERKRSEQALRESEARYRFLAEAMPQIVWIATVENQVTYINNHWCEYTGLTLEQTQQGGWNSVIHPEDMRRAVDPAMEGAASTGEYTAEYRLRRASDGSYRWHHARVRIVRLEDGSRRWLGTAVDIDDRKRMERELASIVSSEKSLRRQAEEALEVQRQIEGRLLLLVEASSALIASPEMADVLRTILDLSRRFVNADAYAVWRRSADGMQWNVLASDGLSARYSFMMTQAKPGESGIPPEPFPVEDVEKVPMFRSRLEEYRAEGVRSLLMVPMRLHGTVEGTVVFYYRLAHRFSELETRVAGGLANLAAAALGTAELYERQTALTRLAESAERSAEFLSEAGKVLASSLDFETTLEAVADMAVPAISDWSAVDILQESGELRRLAVKHVDPAKIALGHEYYLRYPPDETSATWRAVREGVSTLIEEFTPGMLENRIQDPDQLEMLRKLGLVSVIVVPLRAGGRCLGVLTFVNAESGRLFTKADLQLAEELAARAATAVANAYLYRNAKDTETALQRANTELQRANADLNQFAYSASHDLREPLRMVSIFSQMLARKFSHVLDTDAQQYVNYITQGAMRMEELVKDILDFTQSANISGEISSPASAREALRKALAALETAIGESGAVIQAGPLPLLKVQEIHLVQILQNLIGNAIKYRRAETPLVKVKAERRDGYWEFSVRDNGIGIPAQYTGQIFGLFKRLHTSDQYPGTGIGLAICQKIVERYGGRIWVESEPGAGSVFSFTLPAVDESGTGH